MNKMMKTSTFLINRQVIFFNKFGTLITKQFWNSMPLAETYTFFRFI